MPARQIHDVFYSLSYQFCTYKISGTEEKKYCVFCGAENDADADVCCSCGKSMHEKDHLLKEYLYKKTNPHCLFNLLRYHTNAYSEYGSTCLNRTTANEWPADRLSDGRKMVQGE